MSGALATPQALGQGRSGQAPWRPWVCDPHSTPDIRAHPLTSMAWSYRGDRAADRPAVAGGRGVLATVRPGLSMLPGRSVALHGRLRRPRRRATVLPADRGQRDTKVEHALEQVGRRRLTSPASAHSKNASVLNTRPLRPTNAHGVSTILPRGWSCSSCWNACRTSLSGWVPLSGTSSVLSAASRASSPRISGLVPSALASDFVP